MTKHFVIMGICGCGKTTAGQIVQQHLQCPYAEGDDFHSQANKDKMGAGIPLNDDDRKPWLESLRDWLNWQHEAGEPYSVVTCSALKRAYRDILREADGQVYFIHLSPPVDINIARMQARQGHYMKADMVDSQLAILQPLQNDELGVVLDNAESTEQLQQNLIQWLQQID